MLRCLLGLPCSSIQRGSQRHQPTPPVHSSNHEPATCGVPLRRGHVYTLRIYLTKAQAGPGYLDGTSQIKHVGGTG
jgi:hypothetical protein